MDGRVNKLSKEVEAMRKEMHLMRRLLKQQNKMLKEFMIRQQRAMKVGSNQAHYSTSGLFPITSQGDLEMVEKYINDENTEHLVAEVKQILHPVGIHKGLTSILSRKIISEYNLDGTTSKKRFLAYPKLVNVLYQSLSSDTYPLQHFLDDLRRALYSSKKKRYQAQEQEKPPDVKSVENNTEESCD